MGIAALVLGILGTLVGFVPLLFWPALFLSIIGLALGAFGLKSRKGVSIAGIVLSLIGLTVGSVNYYLMHKAAAALQTALQG
jgi:hypothetical protein